MKKVIDVSIGKVRFTIEEEAYAELERYMERFRASLNNPTEAKEVMEDIEIRIAEIFQKEQAFTNQVIGMKDIQTVISQLGEIEEKDMNMNTENNNYSSQSNWTYSQDYTLGEKRLYRDSDNSSLSGVCSGLALYCGIDATLMRIIFVALFFLWGSTLVLYIILILVIPKAVTVADKLRMRGYAVTPENINRFTSEHYNRY